MAAARELVKGMLGACIRQVQLQKKRGNWYWEC